MRLTVIGCAPAYTGRSGRASSCYLVEHGNTAVLLDMGQAAFAESWRYRRPDTVDAVVISHLHADHCVDLIPLRHFVKYENDGQGPRLHGPAELRQRFDAFQAQADFLGQLAGDLLEPGTFTVGQLTIETCRVTHIPDSFAFRLAVAGVQGPGLVYSGDCAVPADLLPLVRAGDTLLCEAALGDEQGTSDIHLNAAQAASIAADGHAGRLVLTHLLDRYSPERAMAAAMVRYGGELALAQPGLAIAVD
jgi:ribonuclease BN (tRNA processing enzyme)